MFISNLKLQGFKSFLNKTNISFGDGITSIVGPNGCGKTNIVDAIRWILGEQKTTVLRSTKMEDIIFNGTASKKPINFCEASLTVKNNKGILPIEYNDVEISRRYYRSGESEYYINKIPCRLKDINDLFIDTGMSSGAYSVIELKMIESILSNNPADRRSMFEEASGINNYKKKRESTYRKLVAIKDDLSRVNDIKLEVEKNVKSLSLQLKRYQRHTVLQTKLENSELMLSKILINNMNEENSPILTKIKSKKKEKEKIEKSINSLKKNLDENQTEFESKKMILDKMNNEIDLLQKDIVNGNETLIVLNEQEKHSTNKKHHFNDEIKGIDTNLKVLNKSMEDIAKNLKNETKTLDDRNQKYNKVKAEHDMQMGKIIEIENHRDALQGKYDEMILSENENNSKAHTFNALLEEKKKSLNELEENYSKYVKELETVSIKLSDLEVQKDIFTNDIVNKNRAIDKEKDSLSLQQNKVGEYLEEVNRLELASDVLKSKIDLYSRILNSSNDNLNHLGAELSKLKGYCGRVSDLFKVDKKYLYAVSACLGDISDYIVIDKLSNAKSILSSVSKKYNESNYKLIILDQIENFKDDVKKDSIINKITFQKKYYNLFNMLLNNYRLENDSSLNIINSFFSSDQLVSVVNLDGKIISYNSNGKINLRNNNSDSLIIKKAELNDLQAEYKDALIKLKRTNKSLDDNQKKCKKFENILDTLTTEINKNNEMLLKNENEIAKTLFLRTQADENCDKLKKHIEETKHDIDSISKKVRQLSVLKKESNNKNLSSLKKEIFLRNKDITNLRDRNQGTLNDLEKSFSLVFESEKEVESMTLRIENYKNQIDEYYRRKKHYLSEIDKLNSLVKDLKKNIKDYNKNQNILNKNMVSMNSARIQNEKAYSQSYKKLQKDQQLLNDYQVMKDAINADLVDLNSFINSNENNMKIITLRMKELFNKNIEGIKAIEIDSDKESLRKEIGKINKSLSNIGPINLAVQDEHDVESERFEYLNTQYNDLIESEKTLYKTIDRLDKEAQSRFLDTFEDIKENFKKTYSMFFEGGSAEIQMNIEDPLNSDIEIFATPPGKRTQNLRVLSAGEKALTAISLLFAIYLVKPSPFCILDEVDAPLDDYNIMRYTKVLKEFSNKTQFIVVTHNKLTMEQSDYLYGVTQQDEGVSQIVSVDINSFS